MRNVFLLVGVAIVVFMAFTAYSIRKEMQGSAQLAAIKDLYFPMLQRLDANIVRIDKIEANFIETAVTGDKDLITKATGVGDEADKAYQEIATLEPALKAKIDVLRNDLKKYQELATAASLAFLSSNGSDMSAMAPMNEALTKSRDDLAAFRKASYDEFVRTLEGSQRLAHIRLIMGLALGFMNLCFMAVLVYFIRNNMKMMSTIAEQNANLEHRVAERTAELSQKTADINAMLHNMKLGVCAVTQGNHIHPEYSTYLKTIFGADDLGGKDLLKTLFTHSTLGIDVKDQISVALGSMLGEDAMMFDLNGHLLPTEMQLNTADGAQKVVRMDWSPIVNPQTGTIDKVLLLTEDVTHLRALELSAAQQKDELNVISRIIRISISKFNEFVSSAHGFIVANRELIKSAQGKEQGDIPALFRNMHTIKGNARTFEFTHITDAAHRAEQTYDRLRKDPTAEWNATELLAELDAVDAAVKMYNTVNEDKLGRKGRAGDVITTRGVFVGNDQLTELRSMAAAFVNRQQDSHAGQLQRFVERLGLIPLSRLVSGSVDSLSSLCHELNKPVPTVDLRNGEVGFTSSFSEALKSSLMHIVRNSLDHGIEAPGDRVRANKPEQGTLRVACEQGEGHVELRVSDDGRGLALHKLYEKGVANGMFSPGTKPTHQEVADLVFNSGLSTAEQVTQVSGRGVGMDAVRVFLKEQGATVRIALKDTTPDFGFAPFEFVISVPEAAYKHAA
jgi:HPt (histidine-containing phosphotransfer) domain-containing protein